MDWFGEKIDPEKHHGYDYKKHFKKLREFNRTNLRPFFPSEFEYMQKSTVPRKRSQVERLFLLIADPNESKLGSYVTVFVTAIILISCITFIVETLPEVNVYKEGICRDSCQPLRGNDRLNDTLVLIRANNGTACVDCEPKVLPVFPVIETTCITLFTIEYVLKLATVHAAVSTVERNAGRDYVFPKVAKLRRTLNWVLEFMSVVDLVAILPFYIALIFPSVGTKLSVIRLIRLFRIFVLPEFGTLGKNLLLLGQMIHGLAVYFVVFLIFSGFGVVVFASLLYFSEKGRWDAASGDFLRPNAHYLGPDEVSPFTSIPRTFWWVFVTVTTVGYGDMVPSTALGKVIAGVSMYCGIFLIALPITIMGISVADFYTSQQKKVKKGENVQAHIGTFLHMLLRDDRKELLDLRKFFLQWRNFRITQKAIKTKPREAMKHALKNLDARLAEHNKKEVSQLQGLIMKETKEMCDEIVAEWDDQLKEVVALLKDRLEHTR